MPDELPELPSGDGDSPADKQGGAPAPAPGQGAPSPPAAPLAGAGAAPAGRPDQGDWIPSYRLREVQERHNQALQQIQQERDRLTTEIQRIRGAIDQQPAEDPETRAVREQMYALFPQVKWMSENFDQLKQLLEQAPLYQEQVQHYWTAGGAAQLRDLHELLKESFGDELKPPAKRYFESAFIDFVENDPEARRRYMMGDRGLARDFWSNFDSLVLDRVRRAELARHQQRADVVRRLPRTGTPTSTLGGARPQKPKTDEELHEAAADAAFGAA